MSSLIKEIKGKIGIIILNWNGLQDTIECVDSVLDQTYQRFKIYLIDNGSQNNEAHFLEEMYADNSSIQIIKFKKNLGFTGAHNLIFKNFIQKKNFEYIALLNNDAVVEPGWLENMVKCAEEEQCDMVSCKMLQYKNKKFVDTLGFTLLNTGDVVPTYRYERADNFQERFRNWGPSGGAALIRISMLEEIGFFDDYFNNGYEDSEFCVRATLLGYKCIFEPNAVLYHKGSVSINKIRNYKYSLKFQKNILYTICKLLPLTVLLLNFPFLLLRNISLLIVGVLTLNFRLSKIIVHSTFSFLVSDLSEVLVRRRKFHSKYKLISTFKILRLQKLFISFYWTYLKRLFVEGKKGVVLTKLTGKN
ncbi:glycosyltransferase [Candidatus Dojkabacteria bacterium]|nr:glycosyltransferase [Candidatus Dojkabacteria bacterium]